MKSKETMKSKEMPEQVRAILFDYDGVLADTMADNCRAWKKAFRDFGAAITDGEYYALEGMSPIAIANFLGKQKGLSQDSIVHISENKARYYRESNSFRLYPGVPEAVKKLKEWGIKLALVSGAARHRIEEMTPREFLSQFDVVVSADDSVAPKPSAEPYIKALKLLRIKAENAVVVENAPLGIEAAIKAGIYCIALTTTLSKSELTSADICMDKITDVVDLMHE